MKKLLTVTCLAGLLSIPSVVFADEAVPEEAMPEEVMSEEAMAEEAMPEEPELSPEMQGHLGDSHSGAVWYGSIRAGVTSSNGTEGIGSFLSRWGIMGSSQVAEGLTAVYHFEQGINATNASQSGRLSYVGLSGGFGNLTVGHLSSATSNSFGAIVDNSTAFGVSGATGRHGAVSYAVSVGNVSLQADVMMKKDLGNSESETPATAPTDKTLTPPEDPVTIYHEDKGVDAYEFGVSVGGIMETGKIAFAHKKHDSYKYKKMSSNYIAGEYGIGGMTVYLGASQDKSEDDTACVTVIAADPAVTTVTLNKKDNTTTTTTEKATPVKLGKLAGCTGVRQTVKTTFAGIRGDVGDTGVSYLVQVRSTKTKGNAANIDGEKTFAKQIDIDKLLKGDKDDDPAAKLVSGLTYVEPKDGTGKKLGTDEAVDPNGQALAANKTTPWVFGLSRSLGGGASVNFEYADDDTVGAKGKSALWLRVDF